jgi:hypothetical protein
MMGHSNRKTTSRYVALTQRTSGARSFMSTLSVSTVSIVVS